MRRWYEDTLEGNGDSPRANAKAYGLLRAIMNSAVDEDLIEASPGASISTRARASAASADSGTN